MRKRLSSKLLAIVLTIAICATTVFGCLMTVSAAESCYSFGYGKFDGDDLTQATIDVTFTAPASLPNGFVVGAFAFSEVNADGEDYLIFKDVTTNDVNVTVEDNYVLFDSEEAVKTAKFTFTVGFSTGAATDKTYQIALSEVELAYNDTEYLGPDDITGPVGEIAAACKHEIGVVGTPDVKNEANNYSVYKNSVCVKCGETFGYQLVPTADENELVGSDSSTATTGTIDLLEFSDDLIANGSESKYFDSNVADNGETGADWANAIIIDSAEELVYICKGDSTGYTKGKYFKVADGIAGFNLSGNAGLNLNGTLADNLAIVKGSGKNHAGATSTAFQGHFDGNGATVYGAWTNHTEGNVSPQVGLFSCVKGDVTIKNVNVKFASFTGTRVAGGIVGYHNGDGTNTLTIENCSVTDSEIVSTGTAWGHAAGAIVGFMENCSSYKETEETGDVNGNSTIGDTIYVNGGLNITNCYVNLDGSYFKSGMASDNQALHGGVVGFCNSNAMKVDKCVVIGIKPYATTTNTSNNNVQHSGLETHFTNVYTDQAAGSAVYIGGSLGNRNFTNKVTQVASLKGSAAVVAMPGLDWGTTWVMDGTDTYPRLALPGEKFDTIYWDGANTKTAPTQGSGTKADPYIISTVAELAYIGGQTRDNYAITDGKYYKIADGIKSIVMQPYAYGSDIKALDSAAATKAYFEANASNMKQWLYYGWEGSTFCGKIDFNGATVYGIYQVSTNNAGLFSSIDAGAEFHNLAIKNSYMVSQSSGANYQCGAIAAVTNGGTYGKSVNGFIWAKNIEIANNYMYGNATSHDRNGIMFGASSDIMYVDNALVYGNDATYGAGVKMPLYSSAANSVLVSSAPAIPEGLVVVDDGAETDPRYYNMTRNSIFLDFNPFDLPQGYGSRFNDLRGYQNCYTDAAVETDTDKNGKTLLQYFYVNTTAPYITQINAADALGAGAQTAMPNLTWGTDWYCGTEGEYPVQTVFATFGTSSVSNADIELIGHNTTYNNDGSVDFNFHFVPKTTGATPVLYVGTLDGSKFMKVNATTSSLTSQLGQDALMYTLPNLSARDIDLVWLPTLVNDSGTIKEWGKSEQLALADNARAILAGDYDTADKNVAAALLKYGAASGAALDVSTPDYDAGVIDLLEFGQYLVDAGSTSQWYDTKLADNGETGADWANAIIIDSAEELVYLCKASGNDTDGKYYKVADGIAGFNLSTDKLDINGTLTGKSLASGKTNLDIIKGSGKNHSGGTPGFQGHFDGNGATVYGAWTNHNEGQISGYAGLFSCVQGDVTIKNINVNKAHFTATAAAGGIIGYYKGEGTNTNNTTLTIENCSVTDSYLEVTTTGWGCGIGAIVGRVDCPSSYKDTNDEDGDGNTTETLYVNNKVIIKNCYVNLDEDNFVSVNEGTSVAGQHVCHGGVVGVAGSNALDVNHCIVIGIKPYATSISTDNNAVQHSGLESHFSNVYTTSDVPVTGVYLGGTLTNRNFTGKVIPLTEEQLTGLNAKDNMTALDWNNVWTTTNGYPTFINKDYKAPASGIVVTWDGTVASSIANGSGTKTDPYIINSASELAWLVQQKGDVTMDKYYKVADGVSAIVLQSADKASDIMALSSAAETKAYFESGSFTQWKTTGWEQAGFCGNFDGNGATIYGMYAKSTNNAALFCTVDAGATIKNIGIKNAYLTSSASNYQVAAIVGVGAGSGYSAKNRGVFAITGCTVANCYLRNSAAGHDRSGVILGAVSDDSYYMENCLVYGNDAYYGANYENKMSLVSNAIANNMSPDTAKLPEGITPTTNGNLYNNEIRNSVILGCDVMSLKGGRGWRKNDAGCYTNVYSDMSALVNGVITYSDGTFTYAENNIKIIKQQDAFGAGAETAMPNLAWGEVWYVGAAGDYPGFKEAGDMPSSAQTLYNAMVLDTMDDYGDSVTSFGMYASGLNLKVNPYMTFTFEFGGEYQRSEKVVVTFKSGDTVIETVTAAQMVNDEDAGRFHLYRLKSAPVTALATGITVSVSYDGGAAVDFGTYSAEGFAIQAESANKQQPCDYYATRYEAAKALLFYAQMLDARYGA